MTFCAQHKAQKHINQGNEVSVPLCILLGILKHNVSWVDGSGDKDFGMKKFLEKKYAQHDSSLGIMIPQLHHFSLTEFLGG